MAFVGSLSGSGGASNTINVTGSMIIANPGTGGLFPLFPGTDTVFFVSGAIDGKSAGSRTVSVFGGDVVASGSITIGTGSIRIDSNEIRFQGGIAKIISGSGGLTFFDSGNAGGVTLTSLTAGAGGGDVDGPSTATDNAIARFDQTTGKIIQDSAVTISDESASAVTIAGSATATTVNLFNTTATTVNAFGAATALTIGDTTGGTTVRNNLTVTGDLTVNGTTTTVNTENLLVEDPLIYFGSGSVGSNRNGGIALASGSSVTNQSLVWGRVANDTWGAGRLDVVSGTLTDLTSMTLVPIRSSKLELGGDKSFITSSNNDLLLNSNVETLFASSSVPTFKIGTVDPDGAFPDPAVPAIFGMGGTLAAPVISSLWISGSRVDLAHSLASVTSGVGIVGGDTQGGLLRITKSGVTPTFNVEGRDGSGAPRALVMTGSTITIGANSSATGITFAGANTSIANLSAASSTTPSFVASQTDATFKVGTGGGTTDTLIISGTTIQLNAGASGQSFRRDNSEFLLISSGASGPSQRALITAGTGKTLIVGGAGETVLSGSNLTLVAGTTGSPSGIDFSTQVSGIFQTYLNVVSGTYVTPVGTESLNAAKIVPGDSPVPHDVLLGASSGKSLFLSGTGVEVNHGNASSFSLSTDGTEYLRFTSSTGLGTLIGGQVAGRNVSLTAAGAGKMILSGSTTTLSGSSIDFVNDSTKVAFFGTSGNSSGLIPNVNNTFDLGTPDFRWRNMYTGDLHLKNERGDWTVIEEEDFLTLTNNKSGKRYKFVLEEI